MSMKHVERLGISETSDDRVMLTVWYNEGWSNCYIMDREEAGFLFNRLGESLGRTKEVQA